MTAASSQATPGRIALALGTVYLVWGSTYLAIRWMVADVPPLPAGGLRFSIAGAVFIVAGLATGGRAGLRGAQLRNAAVVGALLPGVANALVCFAAREIPSVLIALLVAVMPLWIAAFEALRPGGSRPGRMTLAGLLVGFLGTAVLIWRGPGDADVSARGVALALGSSLVWAAGWMWARGVERPKNWLVASGVEMLGGGLLQGGAALATGELAVMAAAQPGPRALGSMIYLVVVGSWLGYGAFSWLVKNARPTLVATYAYVNPLVAVLLGATVGNEPLGWRTLAGGGLIVGSVVLATRKPAT